MRNLALKLIYKISGKDDDDHCDKAFPSHSDFIDGMFVIGCPCPSPVTYGFELMIVPELARHFFRFPNEFKFLRFLVDGAHWNDQRKLKKADRSGGGGHLGCSQSYYSLEYQEHQGILTSTHRGESRPKLSLRNVPRLYIKKIILIICDT